MDLFILYYCIFYYYFLTLYQDMEAGVKKALNGEVETLLLDLLMPPLEYEAHRLQQAMVVRAGVCVCVCMNLSYIGIHSMCVLVCLQGLGTDEETLMEILSIRSGKHLQDISAAYKYCKSQTPPPQKIID